MRLTTVGWESPPLRPLGGPGASGYDLQVPEICRFLGIVITMYHREHEPAHFHARYSGHKVTVRIADGAVDGDFPPRALGHVMEWWSLHRQELAENWRLAHEGRELRAITPLE